KSASIRPTGKHFSPTIASVGGRAALKGTYDAQLINITGTLTAYRQRLNRQELVIESDDNVVFTASFASSGGSGVTIKEGSRISLTGICTVKADENGNPSEFEVVLRSPADVRVVSSPPWFDAGVAANILSGL